MQAICASVFQRGGVTVTSLDVMKLRIVNMDQHRRARQDVSQSVAAAGSVVGTRRRVQRYTDHPLTLMYPSIDRLELPSVLQNSVL